MRYKSFVGKCVCAQRRKHGICTRFTIQTNRTSIPVCNPVPFRIMSYILKDSRHFYSTTYTPMFCEPVLAWCVCMLLVHYYVVCTRYTILTINKWKAAALIDLHLIKCWRGALTLWQAGRQAFTHIFSLSIPKKGEYTNKWTSKKAIEHECNAHMKKRIWNQKKFNKNHTLTHSYDTVYL